jgi:hypothetical protein
VADQASEAVQARNKATEEQKAHAKKVIDEQKQAREQRMAEEPNAGKPTPTQEENDMAASGAHVIDKEPDGSPEEALSPDPQKKQAEAKPVAARSGYSTRATEMK